MELADPSTTLEARPSTTQSLNDQVESLTVEDSQPIDVLHIVNHLSEIYQDINGSIKEFHEKRYRNLKERFEMLYGQNPQFFCRAPGRVNIIGEHVDYCGYAVLPAAIEQDFIMAYSISDSEENEIIINNIDKDQYPCEKISSDPFQKLRENANWLNYFICGYKAVLSLNAKWQSLVPNPKGLKILIDSHVPTAAGLSSSSAFTVCAAVVALHANGLATKMSKAELSQLCVDAERFAGTACGGMDQTISIFAEINKAKLIEFNPKLVSTDVSVPEDLCLVIANSLTPSPKLLTLGTRYNKRVVECRFGLAILAQKTGQVTSIQELIDLKFKHFYDLQTALGFSYEQMLDLVKTHIKAGGYNKQEISKELGVQDISELIKDVPYAHEVLEQNYHFFLNDRATHVFSEAKRVFEYRDTCHSINNAQAEDLDLQKIHQQLGTLMNESHFSCKVLYDCSSPEVDELTQLARNSGALGSRITGAGWGGCCVSLVKKSDVSSFIENVMTGYYNKPREQGQQLWITDDLKRYIFASQPAKGACILDPKYCIWM